MSETECAGSHDGSGFSAERRVSSETAHHTSGTKHNSNLSSESLDSSFSLRSCSDIFDPDRASSCGVIWLSSSDDSDSSQSISLLQSHGVSLSSNGSDEASDETDEASPMQLSLRAHSEAKATSACCCGVGCPGVSLERVHGCGSTDFRMRASAFDDSSDPVKETDAIDAHGCRNDTIGSTRARSPICISFSQIMNGCSRVESARPCLVSEDGFPSEDIGPRDEVEPTKKIVICMLDKVERRYEDILDLFGQQSSVFHSHNIRLSDVILWNYHQLNFINHKNALHHLVDVCNDICQAGAVNTEALLTALIGGQRRRSLEYETAARVNARLGIDEDVVRSAMLGAADAKVRQRQTAGRDCRGLLPVLALVRCADVTALLITTADENRDGGSDGNESEGNHSGDRTRRGGTERALSRWLHSQRAPSDGSPASHHGVVCSMHAWHPGSAASAASFGCWLSRCAVVATGPLSDALLDLEQSRLIEWLERSSHRRRFVLADVAPNDRLLTNGATGRRARVAELARRLCAAGHRCHADADYGVASSSSSPPPSPCLFVHPPALDSTAAVRAYASGAVRRFVLQHLTLVSFVFVILASPWESPACVGDHGSSAATLERCRYEFWTSLAEELSDALPPPAVTADMVTAFDPATVPVHYAAVKITLRRSAKC